MYTRFDTNVIYDIVYLMFQTQVVYSVELHCLIQLAKKFGHLKRKKIIRIFRDLSDSQLDSLLVYWSTLPYVPAGDWEAYSDRVLERFASLVYVDAGYRANNQAAWCVYDYTTNCVDSGSWWTSSSSQAEIYAVLKGISHYRHTNKQVCMLYSDNLTLVNQFYASVKHADPVRSAWTRYQNELLCMMIQALIDDCTVYLSWTSRETDAITVADTHCNLLLP